MDSRIQLLYWFWKAIIILKYCYIIRNNNRKDFQNIEENYNSYSFPDGKRSLHDKWLTILKIFNMTLNSIHISLTFWALFRMRISLEITRLLHLTCKWHFNLCHLPKITPKLSNSNSHRQSNNFKHNVLTAWISTNCNIFWKDSYRIIFEMLFELFDALKGVNKAWHCQVETSVGNIRNRFFGHYFFPMCTWIEAMSIM